jgi:penicillin-binding protein 1C
VAEGLRQRLRRREVAPLLGLAVTMGAGLLVDRILPPPIPDLSASGATVVVARDGRPLRAFPAADGVWRYRVAPADVAPEYLDALIGYEDRWFFHHRGVNPFAIARAAGQALRHGEVVSGGSTITMQVARLVEPIPRTPLGKLKQALRAAQIERRLSKDEILTLYLNLAPFGGNLEGVEAASWAFLGKSARRLSHAEAALLAVLPQAPSRLRPDRHPEAARAARDKVLGRLADLGLGTRRALDEARLEPVVARRLRPPMLAALAAERLRAQHGGAPLVHSTLDADLQAMAERRVTSHLEALPERTSAAVLVVDAATLEARAYVGSARFADADSLGHVDMVRAMRSPGSTLKPFVYALALDDGLIHSQSLLVDAPQSFGAYRPANFGDAFHGPVSAADALSRSLNVPAVDLLDRVGPRRFSARLAHAGVWLALPRGAEPNLAMVLGGTGTDLESLVGAYAALSRGGLAGPVRLAADAPLREQRLMSEGAAFVVREMLAAGGRPGESVQGLDTSRRARVAWKTGTSYGYRDAWAIGATPRWVVGVWIGRPDGTPMPGQYGAVTALPLLFGLVDALPRNAADSAAPAPPPTVNERRICWPLGRAVEQTPQGACALARDAWVIDGVVPPTFPDRESTEPLSVTVTVDARGRRATPDCADGALTAREIARWPARLQPWLDAAQRAASEPPPTAPGCTLAAAPARGALRIDGALPGTVLRRAPGSARPPTVALRALGADGAVDWLVNGQLVGRSDGLRPLQWRFEQPGEQAIVALDRAGRYDRVVLHVMP